MIFKNLIHVEVLNSLLLIPTIAEQNRISGNVISKFCGVNKTSSL